MIHIYIYIYIMGGVIEIMIMYMYIICTVYFRMAYKTMGYELWLPSLPLWCVVPHREVPALTISTRATDRYSCCFFFLSRRQLPLSKNKTTKK